MQRLAPGATKRVEELFTATESDVLRDTDLNAEADSDLYFEADLATLTYQDFRFLQFDDKYEFKIVQTGKDKIVVAVGVFISARAKCEFSFSVWDGIDKDYVPMGSNVAETDLEFEAEALITFDGDISADPPDFEISNLELINMIDYVNFDYIDFNDEEFYEE